jgi:mycothiol S-conjugate amidase
MLDLGMASPYADRIADWVEDEDETSGKPRHEITTRVQCDDYFEIRNQALIAHATQVDPEGGWFAVPAEVQRTAWPTEDYHLARSLVDVELPEDDLFAGIRERVSVCD